MLATLVVNTTSDTVDSSTLSLRDAIAAVNAQSLASLSPAEQSQVSGTLGTGDTITFDSGLTASGPATITLTQTGDNTAGPSALGITANVVIEGATGNHGITLAGNGAERLFFVATTASLTLENLTLSGGRAQGFDGGSGGGQGGGGGGAAGTGGAIFNQGSLTLAASTLSGNLAVGGSGGAGGVGGFGGIGGGGGGGLAGPGQDSPFIVGAAGGLGGGGAGGNGVGAGPGAPGLSGSFGGGGGGGGYGSRPGGIGGLGGFGAGAGGSGGNTPATGQGGFGGGSGGASHVLGGGGGGGAGLGGAIFNDAGSVTITDSTLVGNSVQGGAAGATDARFGLYAAAGAGSGYGGAIFNLNGSLTLTNDTLADNMVAAGSGGSASGGALYTLGDDGVVQYPGGPSVGSASGAVVSLTNSILANSIGGADYVDSGSTVTASHDLATQSSGLDAGITATTAAALGLASALASIGGPTQTLALLPGSLAIDAGSDSAAAGLTTDQRGTGYARVVGTHVDIGAYESEGFTITITGGGVQSTNAGSAFAQPLAVKVTSNNPLLTDLSGGQVTFTAPSSGASATLSANPVALAADGTASTVATANGTVGGPYTVAATAAGIATPASFLLTNDSATTTSVNSSVGTTVYGQNVTFTAAVSAVSGTFDNGGTIQFVIDGSNYGSPQSLDSLGKASITLATLDVPHSPHTIEAFYSGDTTFLASNGQLAGYTVTPATPTVSVSDAGGVYNGSAYAATGSVTGVNNANLGAPVFTYYLASDTSFTNPLPGAPKAAGSYVVVGSYAATGNYTSASNQASFTISRRLLTITADNKTMLQGSAVPTLTARYTGLANGDTPASLTTPPTLATTANAVSLPGRYPITITGAVAPNYTINLVAGTLTVMAAQNVGVLGPDPQAPGKTMLSVFGTSGNDVLLVTWVNSSGDVCVTNNGKSLGMFRPTSRILVYGQAGNDTIRVDSRIRLPDLLYGGDGNDLLWGGGGWTLLEGGDGNDQLFGGAGRAILIGGAKKDILYGGSADTVLIGGSTAYDNNDQALMALLATWGNPNASYSSRVSQMIGSSTYRLTTNTVTDDKQANALIGGKSVDLFFKGVGDMIQKQRGALVVPLS